MEDGSQTWERGVMAVVCNSTPLIYLAAIGRFDLLSGHRPFSRSGRRQPLGKAIMPSMASAGLTEPLEPLGHAASSRRSLPIGRAALVAMLASTSAIMGRC